ncbi:hypothetical protein [Candidatus Poriferisodalis sp.]|uniref:hypothetical protein n=1 Tax=Candidatus Poriferisodalis sp. TaxID=3101277 RepID=UPI003B017FD0
MTESDEINEPAQTRRRKPARGRLTALLVAVLMAATATVAFSAGSVSAQTADDNGDASQQQADDGVDDPDGDGTCDRDGSHRDGKPWRLGASDTLTEVLGIDAETLRTKLKDGSTLADIAAEQGVEASDVVDALVTAITERAAEHDREIDAEELTTKIAALVNGEKPERPEGAEGRKGRGGHHRGGFGNWGRWGAHAHSGTAAPSGSATAA